MDRDLGAEYDERWEQVKHLYPPDPALEAAFERSGSLLDMIRELERITKRKASQ